ncbi:hypothetical protein CEXT_270011 [Caerostris extrusa]|uniref:Uncharacterized protein n=1 Tax=Caerostris extrusa TaxID=172846 RepID=A0AAV4PFI4_CAEEX|nr:hypothetical protein CEXT_270011 [Caerostris extrusa]
MQMDARNRLQGVLLKSGRRLLSSIDLTTWGGWMNPSHHSVAIKGRTELIIICWATHSVYGLHGIHTKTASCSYQKSIVFIPKEHRVHTKKGHRFHTKRASFSYQKKSIVFIPKQHSGHT